MFKRYWILPRYAAAPERGSEVLAWLAFGMFEAGLGLTVFGATTPSLCSIAPVGRLILAGATLLFLVLLFPRVKPFGAA